MAAALNERVVDHTLSEVRAILERIASSLAPEGDDVLGRAERILLRQILDRFPDSVGTGARLLGVSLPTFRRRLVALERQDSERGAASPPEERDRAAAL